MLWRFGDGLVPHQDVSNQESNDSLALNDAGRFSSTAQGGRERCESLGKAQKRGPIVYRLF
jgi:hypothetical protein